MPCCEWFSWNFNHRVQYWRLRFGLGLGLGTGSGIYCIGRIGVIVADWFELMCVVWATPYVVNRRVTMTWKKLAVLLDSMSAWALLNNCRPRPRYYVNSIGAWPANRRCRVRNATRVPENPGNSPIFKPINPGLCAVKNPGFTGLI